MSRGEPASESRSSRVLVRCMKRWMCRNPSTSLNHTDTTIRSDGFADSDLCQFLFQQLFVIQVCIVPVQRQEFVVRAQFDNTSAVQDGNTIGVAHGRDSVGNEDGRTSLHDVAQVIEN